jgi:hypothetical protein
MGLESGASTARAVPSGLQTFRLYGTAPSRLWHGFESLAGASINQLLTLTAAKSAPGKFRVHRGRPGCPVGPAHYSAPRMTG